MTAEQIFADGLHVNEAVRAQGFADGAAGRPWRGMASAEPLSYALGYQAGEAQRACCAGERAEAAA